MCFTKSSRIQCRWMSFIISQLGLIIETAPSSNVNMGVLCSIRLKERASQSIWYWFSFFCHRCHENSSVESIKKKKKKDLVGLSEKWLIKTDSLVKKKKKMLFFHIVWYQNIVPLFLQQPLYKSDVSSMAEKLTKWKEYLKKITLSCSIEWKMCRSSAGSIMSLFKRQSFLQKNLPASLISANNAWFNQNEKTRKNYLTSYSL